MNMMANIKMKELKLLKLCQMYDAKTQLFLNSHFQASCVK